MKTLNTQNFSTLALEEMFNVRGGDGENTSSNNTTSEGESTDVIL